MFGYLQYESICLYVRKDIIQTISIFKIDLKFTTYLLSHLFLYKLSKDDLIYRKGDPNDEIYFIFRGSVVYLNDQGHELL